MNDAEDQYCFTEKHVEKINDENMFKLPMRI